MSSASQCPDPEILKAIALGECSVTEESQIQTHLNQCDSCRTVIENFSSKTLTKSGHPAPRSESSAAPTLAQNVSSRNPATFGGKLPPEGGSKKEGPPFPFLHPPVEDDEIGRLGNYRVLRVLGKGGMGIVFLAEDIGLHRAVALKVMRPEMKGDIDGWKRFLREARTMASIKHDHLVTIYQAGQEDDVVYFAMELLEGESLEAWMKDNPHPDVAEILRLAKELATGLALIHQKGLIHRDIKPANIWLEAPNRRVKILDLGLVRPFKEDSNLTMTGMILGTPAFMSPEQARGEPIDARTDLFSLGCVLYALCTNRRPFLGGSSTAVMMALAGDRPPAVHELNITIPQSLSDLVMKLLARRVKARPASAEEVLGTLAQIEQELKNPPQATKVMKPVKATQPAKSVEVAQPSQTAKKSSKQVSKKSKSKTAVKKKEPERNWFLPIVGAIMVGAILLGVLTTYLIYSSRKARPPVPVPGNPSDPVVQGKQPLPPVGEKKLPEPIAPAQTKVYLTQLKEVATEHWPFLGKGGGEKGPEKGPKKGPKGKDGKDGKDKKDGKDYKDDDKDGPPGPNTPVYYQGQISPHGLFMHPPAPPYTGQPASVTYRLNRQYKTFQAAVSLNDGPERSETPMTFWIYGDGRLLWQSKQVVTQADTQKCALKIDQVDLLKIAVTCAGDPLGAHAVWIEPLVEK